MAFATFVRKVKRALCLTGQAGPDTRQSPPAEPRRPPKQHQDHALSSSSTTTTATLPSMPKQQDSLRLSETTNASTAASSALHLSRWGSCGMVASLEQQPSAQPGHDPAQPPPLAADSPASMLPAGYSHAAVVPAAAVDASCIQLLHAPAVLAAAPQGFHPDLTVVCMDQPAPQLSRHQQPAPAAGEDIHAALPASAATSPCISPKPSHPGGAASPPSGLQERRASSIRAPALMLPGLSDVPLAPHRHGAHTCPSSPLSSAPIDNTRNLPSPTLLRHAAAHDAVLPAAAALLGKHSLAGCEAAAAAAPPAAPPLQQLKMTRTVSFPQHLIDHSGPAPGASKPSSPSSSSRLPATLTPTPRAHSAGREFLHCLQLPAGAGARLGRPPGPSSPSTGLGPGLSPLAHSLASLHRALELHRQCESGGPQLRQPMVPMSPGSRAASAASLPVLGRARSMRGAAPVLSSSVAQLLRSSDDGEECGGGDGTRLGAGDAAWRQFVSGVVGPAAHSGRGQSSMDLVRVAGVERACSFSSAAQLSLPGRSPSSAGHGQRGTGSNLSLVELRETLTRMTSRTPTPRPSNGLEGLSMILRMYASTGGVGSGRALNRAAQLQGSGSTPLHHHLRYDSLMRSQPEEAP